MKINYILQLKDFGLMLLIGFIIGLIYGLLNIPSKIKTKLLWQILSDFIFTIIAFSALFISINIINLGEFRFFLIIGFIFGFIIERRTIGKLFAKGYLNMYNMLRSLLKKFRNSKFGRFIFK
jgi:hypothetical protein